MMSPGWTARLGAVFGVPVEHLDWGALEAARGEVREDEDLDFKTQLYGNGDSDRRELAADIAGLANHRGGVLLLGVTEENGAAGELAPVALSDAEEARMHKIAADNIAPFVDFRLLRIESPRDPAHGVYALVIPPSRDRPHGVRLNDGLRFPIRAGTTRRWLAESEVRAMYGDYFRAVEGDVGRVSRLADQLAAAVAVDNPWVLVSVVPASASEFEITNRELRRMEEWAKQFVPADIVSGWLAGSTIPAAHPDMRRVLLSSGYESPPPFTYHASHLYTDGAAAVARVMPFHGPEKEGESGLLRDDLFQVLAQCLHVAIRHAAENCAAFGPVVVEARLLASSPLRLYFSQHSGFYDFANEGRTAQPPLLSRQTFTIESLIGAQGILAATRALAADFVHAMGSSEVQPIGPGGVIRLGYWGNQSAVEQWAQQNGVPTTRDLVE